MNTVTRLRILRLRHHISLLDLEEKTGISNQHLSRMELGYAKPNETQEALVNIAMCEIIGERTSQLVELKRDYMLCKHHLLDTVEFQPAEGKPNEL